MIYIRMVLVNYNYSSSIDELRYYLCNIVNFFAVNSNIDKMQLRSGHSFEMLAFELTTFECYMTITTSLRPTDIYLTLITR